MTSQRGITTTLGITIMAVAIVAVGVIVYFVYQSTQQEEVVVFGLECKDRLVLEKGQAESLTVLATSSNTKDRIDLAVTSTGEVGTSLSSTSVLAGDEFTVSVTAEAVTESGILTLIAEQAGEKIEKQVSVRVFLATTSNANAQSNVNGSENSNESTNATTNITNGSNGELLRFSNRQLNITFVYPSSWGEASDYVIQTLTPVQGAIKYFFFENLTRFDVPGHISLSATSADYLPTEFIGMPFWFAGTINPELSPDRIMEQIQAAGFIPLSVEKTEIDGRPAVKAFAYRAYYNHYLDVMYVIPVEDNDPYATLMLLRTIEEIAGDDDSEEEAIEKAKTAVDDLRQNKLSDQAMRRYEQFEEAVSTVEFIQ